MFSLGLMPKYFKEIFSHVPTVAFKSVSWSELWAESKDVYKKYNSEKLDQELFETLKTILGPSLEKPQNDPMPGHICPEFALKVYFSQLKNPHGAFLDMRAIRFKTNPQAEDIFVPNYLQYTFSDDFRKNLIDLYKGFYLEDNALFSHALDELGLTKGLVSEKKEELSLMFHAHFGGGNLNEVHFSLNEFHDSFFKIFKFFLDNKVKLSVDFMYLGLYLITLYMHLDKTGPVDLKKIFLSIFENEN